jgi:hypothetical protein
MCPTVPEGWLKKPRSPGCPGKLPGGKGSVGGRDIGEGLISVCAVASSLSKVFRSSDLLPNNLCF